MKIDFFSEITQPMKEQYLQTQLRIYEADQELDPQDLLVLQAARRAVDQAYAPYSRFLVGAAVLLEDGTLLQGANQENAAYPMCLCAERVTLAAAQSQHPGKVINILAVTVRNAGKPVLQPASPCGACRQVLVETEGKQEANIRILMQGESGPIYELQSGKDLLPLYFDGNLL